MHTASIYRATWMHTASICRSTCIMSKINPIPAKKERKKERKEGNEAGMTGSLAGCVLTTLYFPHHTVDCHPAMSNIHPATLQRQVHTVQTNISAN